MLNVYVPFPLHHHTQPWGIIVLWVFLGMAVLIVLIMLTALVLWIKNRIDYGK